MKELAFINHWLGGHQITIAGIRTMLKAHHAKVQGIQGLSRKGLNAKEPLQIVEVGCGGGNNLHTIQRWADKNGVRVELTGIDINEECIAFARSQPENRGIQFICSDYKLAKIQPSTDVIFSSLFCHHFTDEELVYQLQWMYENSRLGFFINDLHRHPIAYYSIKLMTSIFSKSYLVKNDAPLSVSRGFARRDWNVLFQRAGIEAFSCEWKWAFRWLVVCLKKDGREW